MVRRFCSPPARCSGAAVFLLPLALAACTGGDEAEPSTWVGRVQGSDVVVAMVRDETATRTYVCGGPSTYATHSRWFDGELDDGGALSVRRDGWILAAQVDDEGVTGTLTPASGETLDFEAYAVDESTPAGLYAVVTSGCRTGVVVGADDDGEPWLQGTWCDDKDRFAQVTPVLPIERTTLGVRIAVDLVPLGAGKLDVYARPVPVR